MRLTLFIVTLLLPTLAAAADIYSPYQLRYQVTRGDTPIGNAVYRLETVDPSCYRYQGQAVPEGLAALLVPTTNEHSEFCIRQGTLNPVSYRMWEGPADAMSKLDARMENSTDEDVDDRNYRVLFSDQGRSGQTNGLQPRELPAGTVDNNSLHFAIRMAVAKRLPENDREPFDVTVFKENKVKRYRFQIVGTGTMETPAGRFETVRVDRIDDRKKLLSFWLASDRDYLPVRITRGGKERTSISMLLTRID